MCLRSGCKHPIQATYGARHTSKLKVNRRNWVVALLFAPLLLGVEALDVSAQRKIDSIESGKLPPGSRVTLTYPELSAWAARQAPNGVRNPQITVSAPGVATGTALIDFDKVRRSQGADPGWLISKLLEGERPVSVTVRIRSSGGTATVDVDRVVVNGLTLDGGTLDFLIRNVLLPLYPDAVVGKPFRLCDRIEHLDVRPAGVGVWIGK